MVARDPAGVIEDVYEGRALQPPWNGEMEARGEPPESDDTCCMGMNVKVCKMRNKDQVPREKP